MEEKLKAALCNIVHDIYQGKYIQCDIISIDPVSTARVNRVWYLSVHLTPKDPQDAPKDLKMVLKVSNPAWNGSKTRSEVNVIKQLRQRSSLLFNLLPEITSSSSDPLTSKIDTEYILMTRVPGSPLAELWKEIPPNERRSLILQLADIICAWRRIGDYSTIGSFIGDHLEPENIVALEYQSEEERSRGDPIKRIGPLQSFVDYILCYLDIHLGYLEAKQDPETKGAVRSIRKFRDQVVLPSTQQWRDEKFVFTHGDLNAGNILVQKNPSGEYSISGIIDFEWALAAPSDIEHHRCLRWLKDDRDDKDGLLHLLWDTVRKNGYDVADGIVEGSLRHDIISVERITSHLDSYKLWNPTPEAQRRALDDLLTKLNIILKKYSCSWDE